MTASHTPSSNPFRALAARQCYELARALFAGRRVVDLSSANGDGAEILSGAVEEVLVVQADGQLAAAMRARLEAVHNAEVVVRDPIEFLRNGVDEGFGALVLADGLRPVADRAAGLAALEELVRRGVAILLALPGSGQTAWDDEACERLARAASDVQVLRQVPLVVAALSSAADSRPRDIVCEAPDLAKGDHHARVVCANLSKDAIERACAAGAHALVGTLDHDPIERLESANSLLQTENAKLARARLGIGYTAAASRAAKAEQELRADLERAHARMVELDDEVHRVQREAAGWERALRELESSRLVRVFRSYWALRDRLTRRR